MDQTNSIRVRIRTSVSKAELKSRLYDKGISIQTMPSVKRPIPDNAKTYAAKLQSSSKPPMHNYKAPPITSTIQYEDHFPIGTEGQTFRGSTSQLGLQQQTLGKHMKSMSSEPFLKPIERIQKQSQQRDISPTDLYGGTSQQDVQDMQQMGIRPQTSTDAITGGFRQPSAMGKSVSNPQFTTLNMAPYSRPQTQAFGNATLQKDPSKKQARASEEVTSITGLKTMTALGPASMNRPKTSSQDLLKKRSQSNKALKRRIIGGASEAEEKRKLILERLNEEDEERKRQMFNNSPHRKTNEKILGGTSETTDEILRQHFLLAKIRKQTEIGVLQRPSTTDGVGLGAVGAADTKLPPLGMMGSQSSSRYLQGIAGFKGAVRPLSQSTSMFQKSPFHGGKSQIHDQIDENDQEDENYDETTKSPNFRSKLLTQQQQQQQQQLDITKSDKVITNFGKTGNKQGGMTATNKWNDLDKLITLLQNQPDDDGYFIYLKPSDIGDPYDLQPLIEAEQSSKNSIAGGAISKKTVSSQKTEKFFTLSKKGITTYLNDEPVEYISLTDWLIERNFFQQISEKKFFKQFRRWKIIRMWRRNILQKKREEVKNNLTEKLFMLDDVFGPILREHRNVCKEMEILRILDLSQPGHEVFTSNQFAQNQSKCRDDVMNRISETSDLCRTRFRKGINDVLEELRQKINDQNEDEETQKKEYIRGGQDDAGAKEKKSINSDPVFEQLGFKHNLKYGPRSKLRRACSRFLRFSYLLDFLALEALSNIYVDSVKDTITKLQKLAGLRVEYELVSKIQPFGEQTSKKPAQSSNELPFFIINCMLEEIDIPTAFFVKDQVPQFEPAPIGNSQEEDFDPTVHLQLQELEEKLDEAQDLMDENTNLIDRLKPRNLNKLWLKINPGMDDFSSLISESFSEGLECLKHFERWSKHEDLLPYVKVLESWDDKVCDEWNPPDDNNLNCDDWLQEDPYFLHQAEYVNNELTIAFEKVYIFFEQFEPYLVQFWENKQLGTFDIVENEKLRNPTDVIPLLIKRFEDQKTNFENYIPESRNLGMLQLNLQKVKNYLTPSPKDCFSVLKKKLPSMVRKRIDIFKSWLISQTESINKPPSNVETYVKQIQCLDYIDKNFQNIKDKIELNVQIYHICVAAEIESKDSKNKHFVEDIYQVINQLSSAQMNADENAGKKKENMKTKVQSKIPKLNTDVEKFSETIKHEKFLDINQNMYDILNEVEQLEVVCSKLVEKAKKIQEYQKTLDMDVSAFANVDEMKKDMQYRSKLWRALNEFSDLIERWKGAFFDQIQVSEISAKAEIYTKTVLQCERELPQTSTAVKHLKKIVFDFRETMPIVEALGNPKLEIIHWNEIKEILNIREFALEEKQFKLSQLIELKAADHQEDIINVSTTATQEFNLKEQLEFLKKQWNEQELKTKPHKEAFKLDQLDIISGVLDESLTMISNIIGSRYVKRLAQEAEDMSERLNLYYDTLEQWKECQRNWIYLESIFASPDIRRQKPKEYGEFLFVHNYWKKLMTLVSQKPQFKHYTQNKIRLNEFIKNNEKMDQIQKALEAYLEDKRSDFPRFYFLSDDELLQILSNASYIREVVKHINKCFDNIASININDTGMAPDLLSMISQEKEEVEFQRSIKLKTGGVESWMKQIEDQMMVTVAKRIQTAYAKYLEVDRKEWVKMHCGQAVAVVAQITWTEATEMAINDMESDPLSLAGHLDIQKQQLQQLTQIIRDDESLTEVKRKILIALITTDIHARDIVENLSNQNVESTQDFNWQQQLRYEIVEDKVTVKQVNALIEYGKEYMGATSRLVITPLTDRCWITITGAMNINLGAAPAGPAGTGKTESTKDLAKALGIYCVVFNCSEQIEYKMMGRLFSGLAQSGAWSCLDEFNRIDVEVLSVIAQQLLDIKEAKSQEKTEFFFNGKENMPLKKGCGVFITMNPGYAGRTELPDNLKVLFRPVSMMIPAYGLIAEIMLQAEGFQEAKTLSTKMVYLYKLASEQLSQQDHYDFGMRAVKSVLNMAGSIKREKENKHLSEDVVLIRAMRDSNVPKFLADDLPLFQALIQDLFPGVKIQDANFGELQTQIENSIERLGFQKVPEFITKTIQLFDTFNVRFGVMIVGPTGGGKTTCYRVLADAMTKLRLVEDSRDKRFQEVKYKVLNPKSISMGELYGEENPDTKEWTDGLASKIIRKFAKPENVNKRNWCVFDGPVDALWIENMNTVLDDNLTLCLANGERIKLNWALRMLFEVQDLAVASPATVSRCGMVFMTPSDLGWKPYMQSWLNSYLRTKDFITEDVVQYLEDQFMQFVDMGLEKAQPIRDEEVMKTVPVQIVRCICNFLEFFIRNKNSLPQDKKDCERKLNFLFGYSYIWAFVCSFKQSAMRHLDNFLRDFFGKLHIPTAETVFDYFYHEKEQRIIHWEKVIPAFDYNPSLPFFSLLVPTIDTVRFTAIIDMLVQINKPFFITGNTGVGKSIIASNYVSQNQDKQGLTPIFFNFSAQTTSVSIQQTIEQKLAKRGKKCLLAKSNNTCVIFVDDVNMPMVEKYGAQPPIELLRQIIDHGGFYDRPAFFWKTIEKFIVMCAAAPPGGGRSALTPRFMRHFHILCVPDPSEYSMKKIFESILEKFLAHNFFSDQVKKCGSVAVAATIELYTAITNGLLPIPSKFHYTFNLRDVAKVFQGMMMTKKPAVETVEVFTKLWLHECSRVFYDRLINEEDREFFKDNVIQLMKGRFKIQNIEPQDIFGKKSVIFSMLLKLDAEGKPYEEITDKAKLLKTLSNTMIEYNISNQNKMDLVFFDDAIEHICRISRILRQPRGNAMLIGVSGCGKQSLTKLACSMLEHTCFSIKLSKNYKPQNFKDDLKVKMLSSGCDNKQNTFLMTDNQIMNETFLEDLNNVLNTGEITNLYQKEDRDRMADSLTRPLQELKRAVNQDYIYQFYIERLRDNFHIILCMSPVGDQLRIRCRKFPSLVNCCTLDWFDNWPEDALLNVAQRFISNLDYIDTKTRVKLSEMFTIVHKSVEHMSDRFYEELRRKVYTTPKSYLDGINLYLHQLGVKRKEFKENIGRLSDGILKLQTTNSQIEELKVKLIKLQPQLEIENQNAQVQAEEIRKSKVIASQKEIETEQEASFVMAESQKIEVLKKEAENEVAKARPALEEAERAANELTKDQVGELKQTKGAIPIVETVVKCTLIYLGQTAKDWPTCQKLMNDPNFLKNIKNYDKDNVPTTILQKVKPIVTREDFDPAVIFSKNQAAGGMAKWCKSIREYAVAQSIIKPKELRLREMTEKYMEAMKQVETKQRELALIKANLEKLESDFQKTMAYIDQLDEDKQTCERRLKNAGKLIELLGDEGVRWKNSVEELSKEEEKLIGNVFIAAASISYIGPFTGLYREKLIDQWIKLCSSNKIQVSEKYSLVNTLGNPVEIRNWGICGLPSDSVSIDNGILATKSKNLLVLIFVAQRWPLMIDPQTQGNNWVKRMHRQTGIKCLKLTSTEGHSYQKEMEGALQNGLTVLIEDIYQDIDPGLDSVLTKAVYKEEGVEKINFGDRPIMYDKNFRLFITTKLPNPHFLPEICIKLTIINFTVTFEGLEEQLLVDVVINEAPEVEQKRDKLVVSIAESRNELKRLENQILYEMSNSDQDTILENVKLIETLEVSKRSSIEIANNLIAAETVEKEINETRNSYIDVSVRGSILYFVIADLAGIDPMYQNSLMYVKKLFNDAIKQTDAQPTLAERIVALEDQITKVLYINICRGLFEAHKLIYSFLICSSIKRKAKQINEISWNYLLRGAGLFNKSEQPPKPDAVKTFIGDAAWDLAYCLQVNLPEYFGSLCSNIKEHAKKWEKYTIHEQDNYLENIPCEYGENLKMFEKLLILKIFKPEKLMFAFSKYVEQELGRQYAESPVASVDALFADSDKKTPLIFVLSSGADPTQQVIQFAHQKDYYHKFRYKSLGQGQEEVAKALIQQGKQEGNWVLLQNCHLFKSWMPSLEAICEKFNDEENNIHPDFRLILTSMPADYFPVAILQNGLKMTTEPPRGIKANLKRTYATLISEETYSSLLNKAGGASEIQTDNMDAWKRLLFGLTFFHALVQERRKFGPLGWNIRYEFNDSDLDTSIKMLRNFLMDNSDIPWEAMKYMTGQINYGGRVTDDWDRVLLMNILQKFYNEDIMMDGYPFSNSGIYYVPNHTTVAEMQAYIEELPLNDEPEVFGMHQNANITYQQQESEKILSTILNVQPRVVSGQGGKSSEDIIYELAAQLQEGLPPILDKEDHAKEIFKINNKGLLHCLSTVLLQEIERYNKLLNKMGTSLVLLMNAIKGLVIMSPELDLMFSGLLKNQVPPNWVEVSYPSLKPLASWIKDLSLRVEFMRTWLKTGHPNCYWLSGFFFPHGFMTGTLQTYARKHLEAIDLLEFSFKVMKQTEPSEITKAPEDGIYVYGLFIEGARWSFKDQFLEEQHAGEMTFQMPMIHFLPVVRKPEVVSGKQDGGQQQLQQDLKGQQIQQQQVQAVDLVEYYKCPCYKTSVRAGVLSTTGQSTNFILAVDLPCSENEVPEHWTLRGTALLTMLND